MLRQHSSATSNECPGVQCQPGKYKSLERRRASAAKQSTKAAAAAFYFCLFQPLQSRTDVVARLFVPGVSSPTRRVCRTVRVRYNYKTRKTCPEHACQCMYSTDPRQGRGGGGLWSSGCWRPWATFVASPPPLARSLGRAVSLGAIGYHRRSPAVVRPLARRHRHRSGGLGPPSSIARSHSLVCPS